MDYSDMNMRHLRISGVLQRKGRGLVIAPAKRVLAENLAKSTANEAPIMEQYTLLCNGAPLPTDNVEVAKALLDDLTKQMRERHILFDISDLPLTTPTEINIARQRLENIMSQTDEIQYAINKVIDKKVTKLPLVPAGAVVRHECFGEGQVVALEASFPEYQVKIMELPYLRSLPDEVSLCPDGITLLHDRFGEGMVFAYEVVFPNTILKLSYPAAFEDGSLSLDM